MKDMRKKINTIEDLGNLVRQTRKNLKTTQTEAAALCGVGTRFFSELENGKASLHIGKVFQVLKALGLAVILKKRELSHE